MGRRSGERKASRTWVRFRSSYFSQLLTFLRPASVQYVCHYVHRNLHTFLSTLFFFTSLDVFDTGEYIFYYLKAQLIPRISRFLLFAIQCVLLFPISFPGPLSFGLINIHSHYVRRAHLAIFSCVYFFCIQAFSYYRIFIMLLICTVS